MLGKTLVLGYHLGIDLKHSLKKQHVVCLTFDRRGNWKGHICQSFFWFIFSLIFPKPHKIVFGLLVVCDHFFNLPLKIQNTFKLFDDF